MTRETEDRPDPEPNLVRKARRRAELPANQWEEVTSVAELTRDAREALGDGDPSPTADGPFPGQVRPTGVRRAPEV
jgi:hypothetical protein